MICNSVTIPDVTAIAETDKAVKCLIHGEAMWIPKSQIQDESEVYADGHHGDLVISLWLAEQKGLA